MRRTGSLEWRPAPASTAPRGADSVAERLQRAAIAVPFPVQISAILIAAAALRFIGLGFSDLNLDEAVSYYIINRPFLEIITYCLSRAYEHPPMYYLLLHLWTGVAGSSEFALRWFSAALGILNIAVLSVLARRWFGRRVAVLAALLMAVWPLAFQQARDARMYSLLTLIALLTVLAFDKAAWRNRWRDWLLFFGLFVVALSVHYVVALSAVAFGLLYLLWWRRHPELRMRFGVTLGVLIAAPVLLIGVAPGPRASLVSFIEYALRTPWSPARLLPIYAGWVVGAPAEMWKPWVAALAATFPWVLFFFGVAGPRPADAARPPSDRQVRSALPILVLVPALAGSALFFFVAARHHSAMLGLFILGVAAGVYRLYRRHPVAGILVVFLILTGGILLAVWQPGTLGKAFSTPVTYIEDRARAGEPMIFTYYFDRFQRDYYVQGDLPAYYLGNQNQPIVPEEADKQVANIMKGAASAWMVLRPDEFNPEAVEKALNAHAYPGQKQWFEGGRAVVHYFAPLYMVQYPGGAAWDPGIRLNGWARSYNVPAGDAVRLEFAWQPTEKIDESLLVGVDLVDDKGHVWAQRIGEPCNGLCPTYKWDGSPVFERQALQVPADTPPGAYHLYAYWMRPDGSLIPSQPDPNQPLRQDRVFLADVTVDPPQAPVPAAPPLAQVLGQTVRPGLVLRSVGLPSTTAQAGSSIEVPVQWQVAEKQPRLDVQFELAGPMSHTTQPERLGPSGYPTDFWAPGRLVRTELELPLPGGLATGRYQLRMILTEAGKPETAIVAPLGSVSLVERPRRYQMPETGVATEGGWHQGIRLARVSVPAAAKAGSGLPVSLVWQAAGPSDRNWKVFIHVLDSGGNIVAQGDAYPVNDGDGAAPTSTWRKDEVIIDDHRVGLPPNLPPGTYRLVVGLYEEGTNQRLPLESGGEMFELPVKLSVTAP